MKLKLVKKVIYYLKFWRKIEKYNRKYLIYIRDINNYSRKKNSNSFTYTLNIRSQD